MIWVIAIALIAMTLFYVKVLKPLAYWKERGVVHKKSYPLIGSSSTFVYLKESFLDYTDQLYKEFSNERYFGVYQYNKPALYLRDPDLIKEITVKHWDKFIDHDGFIPVDMEPLMGKNLFALKGQQWRDMRPTLTPSFSSSKMRIMFTLMSECTQRFINYFDEQDQHIITAEMKDTFSRVSSDTIASVAFGIDCDSLREQNNEFYEMTKKATSFTGAALWRFTLFNICPYLGKMLKIRLFSARVSNFFMQIVKETIMKREKYELVRPDVIHLLMEARKGKSINGIKLTDEDIAAQVINFLLGGFEVSASLTSLTAYELAVNTNIQKKLQSEIDITLKEHNGEITYEVLNKLKYLEMVISESLRKWPICFQTDRVCVKEHVLQPANPMEKPLLIEKDTLVLIPTYAIHRDPQYFPNPEVFDPERFNEDNKNTIQPYTYLPFGAGPRKCIASRFATLQIKTVIVYLLSKFDLVVVDKTPIPLKIKTQLFSIVSEQGFWLGLRKRQL